MNRLITGPDGNRRTAKGHAEFLRLHTVNRPVQAQFAAVGDDGRDPVVWGLGDSPEAALADARQWLRYANCRSDLVAIEITWEQAEAVRAGIVRMDDLARIGGGK